MLRAQFDRIVTQALAFAPDASDFLAVPGKPLQAAVDGALRSVPLVPDPGPLTPFQTEAMAFTVMGRRLRLYRELQATGSCDLAYQLPGGARFRVNVFSQRGSLALALRQLSATVPDMESLSLPAVFQNMAREQYGLFLVTGGTGTGKSTSLASLVDRINATRAVHIVTLEDPVEFVHPHRRGVVNQRELGLDFDTYASGLRAALRQAPGVILVGEIRDRETLTIALEAAETGHFVLGTLHTSDTVQTVNRIVGMFDPSDQALVRARLAESLKAVVSQRLLPRVGGGRVAAFEILCSTLRMRDLIRKGESADMTFYDVITDGATYGMRTFDQSLKALFEDGVVTQEAAMLAASDKAALRKMLDRVRAERGERVSDIAGLSIDSDYGL